MGAAEPRLVEYVNASARAWKERLSYTDAWLAGARKNPNVFSPRP
jgi:hypothetical protein